ncbi:MAG: hypothetical protein WCZ65_10625 [Lysobacteraceae bacterium]
MIGIKLRLPTVLLGAFCVWSLLVLIVVETGLGRRYGLHPVDPELIAVPPSLSLTRARSTLGELSLYAGVAERPLFNEDRRPTPPPPEQAVVAEPTAPPPMPLDVLLTSVIVHGDTRIAQITDRKSGASQAIKPGESLLGDQSAWRLVELMPRSAVFEGPGGQATVDLRVFDGQGGEPPTPPPTQPVSAAQVPPAAPPADGAAAAEAGEPAASNAAPAAQPTPEERAQMIRQRIQERRRQMREEAARAAENKN